ncbi:hypothetical protein L7F22_064209 [Adiantum nelumboides]|nr:hypothetical protein [Adiantum nelumboides]
MEYSFANLIFKRSSVAALEAQITWEDFKFQPRIMGVEKTLLKAGTGPKPAVGQTVTVHCTGYGKNGDLSQKFWSTKDPGQQPFKFQVGQGRVIKGTCGKCPVRKAMSLSLDGNKEEGSSLEDRQPIPTAHEIGESSGQAEEALQVVTTVTMFKQLMENPRFMEVLKSSSIAHQVQGSFDMPRGTFGMAGYQNQQAGTAPICPVVGGPEVFMPLVSVPMLQTPPMDQLMAYGEPKPYKEDVQSVQFDTFSGFHERNKGWDEGVLGMQIGEVARLKCSPDYAYGAGGFPAWGIQPNSELVFEIEVIDAA